MYSAVSPPGLKHFRHGRRDTDKPCWLSGETLQHMALKARLAPMVDAVPGWHAALEVSGDGWRADVLGTGPGGRRIAFEAQWSYIDRDVASERTHAVS